MRFYFISGEASGDLHASKVIRELKLRAPKSEFRAWGGDLMEEAGATIVKHYRDLAFMGFAEVLANIGTIMRNIRICKSDIQNYQPDAIVLIDYPGFNLRIAKWAKKQGFKVYYYISPQLWAWKKGRVEIIRQFVDQLYVILPFELSFYKKEGIDVNYVGHPLLDAIQEHPWNIFFREQNQLDERPILALLPGSRKQEITNILPIMLKAAESFSNYQVVVAGAPAQPDSLYESLIKDYKVRLLRNDTYNLLKNSHLAAVTSGTATLETALIGVPEVVVYKGSRLSYEIGKRIVDIPFISLVNLILEKLSVTELIQTQFTVQNLTLELKKLENPDIRERVERDYQELRDKLGNAGASKVLAEDLLKRMLTH